MSIACYMMKFAKKENSLAKPQPSDVGVVLNIELKDGCSIVNPILLVNTHTTQLEQDTNAIFTYNYCYIPEFSRYYYIDDWTYNPGLWIANTHVDCLSSWRKDILDSYLFIMRSTRDSNWQLLYNTNLLDSKYPTTAEKPVYRNTSFGNPYSGKQGMYVVGIVSSGAAEGTVTYYCFTNAGFRDFCYKLFTYSTGWLNIDPTEISENLQKALINPFQYIVSCIYLPIDEYDVSTSAYTYTINFGWWSITTSYYAYILSTKYYVHYETYLPIPRHPDTSLRGNYLNLSPYAIYTLRYYPYGTIDIDTEAIASYDNLYLYSDLDLCTGKAILNICLDGFNNPIRTIEAMIGVQIPTASLQTNFNEIASGKTAIIAAGAAVVGKIADASTSTKSNHTTAQTADLESAMGYAKPVTARAALDAYAPSVKSAVTEAASDIKQTLSDILSSTIAASTTAEIQGMQGVGSQYDVQTITLSGRFLPVAPEDFEHTGRPLMAYRQVSSLSGFAVAKEADIEIPCTDRELKTIKAYLEAGFFVE